MSLVEMCLLIVSLCIGIATAAVVARSKIKDQTIVAQKDYIGILETKMEALEKSHAKLERRVEFLEEMVTYERNARVVDRGYIPGTRRRPRGSGPATPEPA